MEKSNLKKKILNKYKKFFNIGFVPTLLLFFSSPSNSSLINNAVENNNNQEVINLLVTGRGHVNEMAFDGWTPIIRAASKGYDHIIGTLTAAGANVNQIDVNGDGPVTVATISGHNLTVAMLLHKGANVDGKRKDGMTPLMLAARNGNVELVKTLLAYGANKEALNGKGRNALYEAVDAGSISGVNVLIGNGLDLNTTNELNSDLTPLIQATINGNEKMVKHLLEKGAKIDGVNKKGSTALFGAVGVKNLDMVKLLVQSGGNIEGFRKDGTSLLIHAASLGAMDIVKLLLKKGADIRKKDSEGINAEFIARKNGFNDLANFLKSEEENKINLETKREILNKLPYKTKLRPNFGKMIEATIIIKGENDNLKCLEKYKNGNCKKYSINSSILHMSDNGTSEFLEISDRFPPEWESAGLKKGTTEEEVIKILRYLGATNIKVEDEDYIKVIECESDNFAFVCSCQNKKLSSVVIFGK